MELKKISPNFFVSPQITPEDIPAIADEGFRTIICNRPDGEGPDQQPFAEIEAAAKAAGLETHYVPVQSGMVKDEDVDAFGAKWQALHGPVLAYCRTGKRSAMLWSLHAADKQSPREILAAISAAGFDLSAATERIANGGKSSTLSA